MCVIWPAALLNATSIPGLARARGLALLHPERTLVLPPPTPLSAANPFEAPPRISSASYAVAPVTRGSTVRRRRHRTSSRTRTTSGLAPETPSCASDGTTTPTHAPGAVASIGALSAARRVTTLANAPLKVVTPLHHAEWYGALKECSLLSLFEDVPHSIQHGFKTGVSSTILINYIPSNHSSAILQPDIINEHIANELQLGRYSGPFSTAHLNDLIGPFRTAPFGVVPKPNSSKFRVIQDLSFPRNDTNFSSVNSEIDSADFPCEWGTFAQCYFLVAKAPAGTQVAVFDVDSAYRNIPVLPAEQPHFCVSWNGMVYIDHCVAFGSASSAGLFGRVADAFVAIIKAYGAQQVLKWVDDIIFFRYPLNSSKSYSYSYSSSLIFDCASRLGIPWSLPKFHDFSPRFTYLGFLWDIPARTVQIPDSKKLKFSNRCIPFLSNSKQNLRSSQALLGSLNHCCLVLRSAKTRLFHLRTFVARFPPNSSPFLSFAVPPSLQDDIRWWSDTLSQSFVGCSVVTPPPVLPLKIYVDASTSWGIGILINNKWAAWHFLPNSFSSTRSIGWAEMVAVELAVSLLCSVHPRKSHFLIHSDNQGVIGAIDSSYSRGASQNSSLSRLSATLLNHESFISTEYIRSELNPADPVSRGILPSLASRLRTNLKLAPDLVPYLSRS